MSTLPFPQAATASLEAHSQVLAAEAARRMVATIPRYAEIPVERLAAQNRRTVEQIARMMDESNFPVAREYFEQITESRARAGISIDDFLLAVEVMVGVVEEHVRRVFADDPAYRDRAVRVLHAGTVFTRTVISRRHLRRIVEQTGPDHRVKPDSSA